MSTRILGILSALLLSACQAVSIPPVEVVEPGWGPPELLAYVDLVLDFDLPVVLQDAPLLEEGCYGRTWFNPTHYLVEIDPRLSLEGRMMVLLHELAHVQTWENGYRGMDHGEEWGKGYSQVFQAWTGENQISLKFSLLPVPKPGLLGVAHPDVPPDRRTCAITASTYPSSPAPDPTSTAGSRLGGCFAATSGCPSQPAPASSTSTHRKT